LNLRQLRHFIVVAESGTLHRGSARLNLSQPALSKSIRALEADLGVDLFDRVSRGVRLTPVGRWLLARSRPLLDEAERLRREIEAIARQSRGQVRIGVGTVLCAALIPEALARLHRVAPGLEVGVLSGYWDDHRRRLLTDEIDLVVADSRELGDDSAFVCLPLPGEPIGLFGRAGHPLAAAPTERVGQGRFAGLTRLPRDLVRAAREAEGLAATALAAPSVTSDDFALLRAVAARTDLMLFAPPSAVAHAVAAGDLVRIEAALPAALRTHFAIIRLRGREPSGAASLMIEAILDAAGAMG
jgi:DNA-binding transcriptional LysR family regulator